MLRATLLALSLALSAPQVSADAFDDAVDAYQSGDYLTAAKTLKELAEQGHVIAQYNLGHMYDSGLGVSQDYAEAVRWLRLAAAQGDADAQNNLGIIYMNGEGVPQNYAEALNWYSLLLTKVMPPHKLISASCTITAKAFFKTTWRL